MINFCVGVLQSIFPQSSPNIFHVTMTARKLPSLNALRAFEASARHRSFTLAAQEMSVTQGAVSHQVKALEDELGLKLFERLHNQLRLSDAGQRYLEVIRDAFDRIESGTQSLQQRSSGEGLVISVSPNFASKWLVPRLGRFSAQYPAQDLRLELAQRHVNFAGEEITLAIRYGEGAWPGLRCIRLGEEFLLPVCAPSMAPVTASEVARHTLLHVHDHRDWMAWFEANQQPPELAARGIVFNQESLAVDAAVAGQGIALARATLAIHDLTQNRLHIPVARVLPVSRSYWLVYPERNHAAANVTAFREWLLQAFAVDREFWCDLRGNLPEYSDRK